MSQDGNDIPVPAPDATDDSDVAFTPRETDCLRAALDSWPKKSRDEKAAAKEELITDFLKERKIEPKNPWARGYLRGKIGMWLSNRSTNRDNRLPKALKTAWTGREVFNIQEDQRIAARAEEIREDGKIRIAALMVARSEMWNDLTDKEQAEYEEKADKWTDEGPDPELRALIAEKRLADWIQTFVLWCHDQCGALGRFEFCVLDKADDMTHGVHDISMIWHASDRQVPTYDMWRVKHPKRTWEDYCSACFHPEKHRDDPDAPRAAPPPHEFAFFDDGTPILPPITQFRHGKDMNVVLHAFFTLHWAAASGIKDTQVAWTAVAKNTAQFLPTGALPDDFVFQNPMRVVAKRVKELWEHILHLQTTGESREERFHWTHWWKRVGQGEDAGERLEATYGTTPRPKHIVKGTRKGHAARAKRAPPKGAFGLAASGDESSSTEEEAPEKVKGGKKKKSSSKKKADRTNAQAAKTTKNKTPGEGQGTAKVDVKGKGKAKAADESASAESSGVGSGGEQEPQLHDEDSPDSHEEEEPEEEREDFFNLDVSDPDLRPTANVPDGRDAEGNAIAGPSRPKRRVLPRAINPPKNRTGIYPPEAEADPTPEPDPAPRIAGPWDDAPVGKSGLAKARMPPRRAMSDAAAGRPPSWVENDPERIVPFLWALNGEPAWRNFLKSWKHMFRRRAYLRDPDVSEWANWDSDCWGVPSHYHATRDTWAAVTDWICEHAPSPTSSASETQQWALVTGLALRDIYTGNECEPDPDSEVPGGGPDYLRGTQSLLTDALDIILPLCTTSQHPGGDLLDAALPPSFSGPVSHKASRIMGKRGAPPGVRATSLAGKLVRKSQPSQRTGNTSADEVEMAVTGAIGSGATSAVVPASSISRAGVPGPRRPLRLSYVDLSGTSSRRSAVTPSHQAPPTPLASEDMQKPGPTTISHSLAPTNNTRKPGAPKTTKKSGAGAKTKTKVAAKSHKQPVPEPEVSEDIEMAEDAPPTSPSPPPLRRSSRKRN